jgi:hypothetical protein
VRCVVSEVVVFATMKPSILYLYLGAHADVRDLKFGGSTLTVVALMTTCLTTHCGLNLLRVSQIDALRTGDGAMASAKTSKASKSSVRRLPRRFPTVSALSDPCTFLFCA